MTTRDGASRQKNPTWVVVALAVGVGLFYAFFVWSAVDLLVLQASGPLGLNPYGWFVLTLSAVFPLIAFGAAFALGRRRRPWQFALVLVTGMLLSAVFWLNVVAYAAVGGAALLG